jgi:hypothetical protein
MLRWMLSSQDFVSLRGMESVKELVSERGKQVLVDTIVVGDFTVIKNGRFLRIASVKDQWWEIVDIKDPAAIVSDLRAKHFGADIFRFSQWPPIPDPLFNFYHEWDNLAALPLQSYDHWLNKQAHSKVKVKIKKALSRGVVVRVAEFDDEFVNGVCSIYNENPIRQGTRFWHYGKNFETVKRENATFLNKSTFLGAYYNCELIGFIKLVDLGRFVATMQVISKIHHRDKAPTNALIAKAVEISVIKGAPYLVYGNYIYGGKADSSLTEFKRHNGFQRLDFPNYFVPITKIGLLALSLKLHHGLKGLVPEDGLRLARKIRERLHSRTLRLDSAQSSKK